MKGVKMVDDVEGKEAARFGAETSGHVMLYDKASRLIFSGGITGARGRIGDNPGARAVIAHLMGNSNERAGSPTFGCLIREEARDDRVLTP